MKLMITACNDGEIVDAYIRHDNSFVVSIDIPHEKVRAAQNEAGMGKSRFEEFFQPRSTARKALFSALKDERQALRKEYARVRDAALELGEFLGILRPNLETLMMCVVGGIDTPEKLVEELQQSIAERRRFEVWLTSKKEKLRQRFADVERGILH